MELEAMLEKLVTDKELYDATPECQAVFNKHLRAVVSASLYETLTWFKMECSNTVNTPIEEMFLDIKKAFQNQTPLKKITDIDMFLATGRQSPVALEILQMPNFVVCVIPFNSIRTLFICQIDEAPENWGIML